MRSWNVTACNFSSGHQHMTWSLAFLESSTLIQSPRLGSFCCIFCPFVTSVDFISNFLVSRINRHRKTVGSRALLVANLAVSPAIYSHVTSPPKQVQSVLPSISCDTRKDRCVKSQNWAVHVEALRRGIHSTESKPIRYTFV